MSRRFNHRWGFLALGGTLLLAIPILIFQSQSSKTPPAPSDSTQLETSVARPAKSGRTELDRQHEKMKKEHWGNRVGATVPLPLNHNPDVMSIANAFSAGTQSGVQHPERLSAFVSPPPFDRQAFLEAPDAYLHIVAPGRVFQAAQPGPGVSPIKRSGDYFHQILQGESVFLETITEPHMPVTYYSNRLGKFENDLTSITVQADSDGLARTQFTATPGTYGDLDLLAASPVRSSQARWLVRVRLPD